MKIVPVNKHLIQKQHSINIHVMPLYQNADPCFSTSFMQLLSIISPERYTEQLLDEHNQGIFASHMGTGIPKYDIRINSLLRQLDFSVLKLHTAFYVIQWACGFGVLLLVCCYAESWLQWLRTAIEKHNGWLAVFWGTVNVCFILNVYTILKIIASTCIKGAANCRYGAVATPVVIAIPAIPAIVCFLKFKHHLPPPRMWQLCFPWNCSRLSRLYLLLSSWIVCFTLIITTGVHIPHAILLLSTNYLLYGTALVAIYLLLATAICLTALIYTIDQMFCINMEFRLTCRQGIQQVYCLLVAAVAFFGTAGFAISLHLLLYLSKNGQKTQSISTAVFTIFSTVFLIIAPWAIRTAGRKMQQALFHKWETMHEEANTTSLSTRTHK